MLERFYPDMYIASAYDIDYKGLYDKGYRGIIFDVDNTLVEHGAPVTKRAKELFEELRNIGSYQTTKNIVLSRLQMKLLQSM